jgi:hypothetical protein
MDIKLAVLSASMFNGGNGLFHALAILLWTKELPNDDLCLLQIVTGVETMRKNS